RGADSHAAAILTRVQDEDARAELRDRWRLQEVAKALVSEHDLDRLLSFIVDAAIEMTGAERGFLILVSQTSSDEIAFKVARNMERGEVERPDRKISNTIANESIQTGGPVVTGDAAKDDRYSGASSVGEMRLRSVVAVPLRLRGKVTGALYL